MKDFFRFRSELLEGKKEQKHKDKSKELTELDKDEDDPCWDGYVKLGTKMKNGKEVPNCVPKEEARKQMKNESALNEGSADTRRFMRQIVQAFKPISRKEKIAKTFSYKPGKDYASVPVIITYNKSEDEYASYIWSPRLKDMLHHDFYGDLDDAVDDAKFEIKDDIDRGGEFVPGRQRLRMGESVNENTTVEVSPRDARKANDIASDMFRGEYENDGSNTFVFDDDETADEFRAELEKQRIELLEETKPKSGDREAYKKFFNKALKKFGADSLADLDDDKQKEFFNYVDKNWESEDEKNESVPM